MFIECKYMLTPRFHHKYPYFGYVSEWQNHLISCYNVLFDQRSDKSGGLLLPSLLRTERVSFLTLGSSILVI